MKIKVSNFENYTNFFIADRDSMKEWLKEKGWTALHGLGEKKPLGHVPIEKVFEDIDKGVVGISTNKEKREGHQLSILIDNVSTAYYITEIKLEDLDNDGTTKSTRDFSK